MRKTRHLDISLVLFFIFFLLVFVFPNFGSIRLEASLRATQRLWLELWWLVDYPRKKGLATLYNHIKDSDDPTKWTFL